MPEPLMNFHDEDRELDLRITQALEQPPAVHISEDFASRVVANLPERSVRLRERSYARIRSRRVGYAVAAACLILLAIAMLALAPHTTHNIFYIALEWTLAAQFCLIAAWIANPRQT